MDRDFALEREAILAAARAYGFDGSDIADLALGRAGHGPIESPSSRDFAKEAIEEASDGLNYGGFALQLLRDFEDTEDRAEAMYEIGEMLRCFAGAYYHAQRVRHFMREARNVRLAQ